MVDYGFYANTYLGSAIPETAFSGAAQQAKYALERFKRRYQVTGTPEGEMLALCAMAEEVYAQQRRPSNVISSDMGQVSVRYAPNKRSLERRLYDQALLYLDIYRGVGA